MAVLFRRLHGTLDRIDATLDRNTVAFERNTEAFERNTEAFGDLQTTLREARIRDDRRMEAVERSYAGMMVALDRLVVAIEDLREESRAHTSAIRTLLDRWGEGPTPAS